LGLAVGHIPGTALPGQSGNVAVAGHRDTLFLGLKGILPNDLVRFETLQGNYEYRVESTEIVKPEDVGVLRPGPDPELTLVTCYPFNYIGSAPDRFIIKALEVTRIPETQISQSAKDALQKDLDAAPKPGEPRKREAGANEAQGDRVPFEVARYHSQTLAPGISIGIDNTDPEDGRVNGWMWIMPDKRTIWLRDQRIAEPVVFYGHDDGKRRELLITRVTDRSAAGYLLMN
jgi:LPXTG-site transpeptidase (sortase) family protein